jgi:RNA polymerase sigma-70 factor (ECF subfamily)
MASSKPSLEEHALRTAVLAGDERAWQALYDAAFAGLYAYVAWRCGGLRDLAEEVVQETWLVAVRRMRSFDPAQATFLTWLRGIAANLLRNRCRAAQQPRPQPLDAALAAADSESEQRDEAEAITRALAGLPERYEAVLRAKYLEQQSVADIAGAWHETPKAIESLLSRARQAFRDAYPIRETTHE